MPLQSTLIALAGTTVVLSSISSSAPVPPTPSSVIESVSAADQDALEGVLVPADVLDVPADWVITDIDPSLVSDPAVVAEFDPFLGLIACPEGTLREGPERAWLGRRYSASELPLENGLLSIELIVEVESDDEWESDRAALEECQAGEQTSLVISDTELRLDDSTDDSTVDGSPTTDGATANVVPATVIEILASPSGAVPYPSAFDAVIVHRGEQTVMIVLGGVDMGVSYTPLVEEIAVLVLESVQPTPDEL